MLGYTKAALMKDNVVIAINCGGKSYIDEQGIKYEKVIFVNLG
jgi:hypothetical protein